VISGDFGVVAPIGAVGRDRWLPGPFGQVDEHGGDLDGELVTDHEPHLTLAARFGEPV